MTENSARTPITNRMVRSGLEARDVFLDKGFRASDKLIKFVFLFFASFPVYGIEVLVQEIQSNDSQSKGDSVQ